MTSDFRTRIAQWDEIAQSAAAQRYIATASWATDYEASGRRGAQTLVATIERVGGIGRAEMAQRSILDFGCGDGRITRHLGAFFGDVWGADASSHMLDRLEREPGGDAVTTLQWNGVDAPPEFGFDIVCSFLCLFHHRSGVRSQILNGLAGVVERGGLICVQMPLYEDAGREPSGWTSVGTMTPGAFASMAESSGLEILEARASQGRWVKGRPGAHHGSIHVLRKP